MTSTKITELRELLAKATAGEWIVEANESDQNSGLNHIGYSVGAKGSELQGSKGWVAWLDTEEDNKANARFIAEVKNALPSLLDEIERTRKALEQAVFFGNLHIEPEDSGDAYPDLAAYLRTSTQTEGV